MAFLTLDDPRKRIQPETFSLWALGFRPFYLLAAAFSAIAIPLWILQLYGRLSLATPGLWWHAHEMMFGFVSAVIVGFLFTAGRNWTGLPTPTGSYLAGLSLAWLGGRLAMAFGSGWLAALIDLAFLPSAAFALGRVLLKAGNRRNYFLPAILLVMTGVNLLFHLSHIGVVVIDPLIPLRLMLGLVVMVETIIGGRVIPTFTSSALKSMPGFRQWLSPRLNQVAISLAGITLLGWSFGWGGWFVLFPVSAAVLQLLRSLGWNPWATRSTPLLWILHAGHLWLGLGMGLIAASMQGLVPVSAPVHALAIGATGGLIIGMITRTALGHTGRMLVAGRVETAAYSLVQVAAVARVLTLVAFPAAVTAGIHIAATCWSLAFLLYLGRYAPWLIRARIDGQPG